MGGFTAKEILISKYILSCSTEELLQQIYCFHQLLRLPKNDKFKQEKLNSASDEKFNRSAIISSLYVDMYE
jgi:hypothetical protein